MSLYNSPRSSTVITHRRSTLSYDAQGRAQETNPVTTEVRAVVQPGQLSRVLQEEGVRQEGQKMFYIRRSELASIDVIRDRLIYDGVEYIPRDLQVWQGHYEVRGERCEGQ